MTAKFDNALFCEMGRALYGERWQTAVAEDLAMTVRHVQRMAAGTAPVRPGIYRDLATVARRRADALVTLAQSLDAASPDASLDAGGHGPVDDPMDES